MPHGQKTLSTIEFSIVSLCIAFKSTVSPSIVTLIQQFVHQSRTNQIQTTFGDATGLEEKRLRIAVALRVSDRQTAADSCDSGV
jgi:hypothetical protein